MKNLQRHDSSIESIVGQCSFATVYWNYGDSWVSPFTWNLWFGRRGGGRDVVVEDGGVASGGVGSRWTTQWKRPAVVE